ncbi:hypothetical protein YC2023_073187 [Brassica napus]
MSKSRREIGRRNKKEYKGGRRREGDDIRKPTHTLDISLKHLNFPERGDGDGKIGVREESYEESWGFLKGLRNKKRDRGETRIMEKFHRGRMIWSFRLQCCSKRRFEEDLTSLFTDIYFIDMEVWVGRGEMVILERRFPTPNDQDVERQKKFTQSNRNGITGKHIELLN